MWAELRGYEDCVCVFCLNCEGTGAVAVPAVELPCDVQVDTAICPACGGSGVIEECKVCKSFTGGMY